ncbi:MAG: tRNA/tmRNA/rRNA uracil-C5-methylase [Frankiales bacterium]|nr:tRNA/tmRNA/rRNA uracil-C5-methylase [Frankiales bacterium]
MILTVGNAAAGGSCVARAEDGRVVFVRHALPGETVRAEITSEGSKFLRADAVEVLTPAAQRVVPPCPYAGPGLCGGCDWQHASPSEQLSIKTFLVEEQLRRVGGFWWDGSVEAVEPLLGWRTRSQWARGIGFHKHRSSALQLVDHCLLSGTDAPGELGTVVEVMAAEGQRTVVVDGVPREGHGLRLSVLGRSFEVAGGGFWQVHTAAPTVLATEVLRLAAAQPGESVVDLYAGVGLFASLLGAAVGPTGSVVAVEASARACADAARNTADQPWVKVRTEAVTPQVVRRTSADVIVLDPPRAGAGLDVSAALAALRPRAVVYVSCDPATFARDLKVFLDAGWGVESLRAFDLYPQTEHVELVSLLVPPA